MKTDKDRLIDILSIPIHPRIGVAYTEVVADYLLDNDVLPVVRCRDCVHWGKHDDVDVPGETERVKACEWAIWMIGDNGYCSYGERKDDDE